MFQGAQPFAGVMPIVLILLICVPALSLVLLNQEPPDAHRHPRQHHRNLLGYFGARTDPRFREVIGSLAKHLHAFTREVGLPHDEWRKALEAMEWAAKITTPERNEFVLLVEGHVRDANGNPVTVAEIDIWQTAPNGLYSGHDPDQDITSFHGVMTADENGPHAFTTVRPVSYTMPTDGPVGAILNAAGRRPWRPPHLHFIVKAKGSCDLVTEVFPDDDPYLDEDTVFGVRSDPVMTYRPQPAGSFPDGFALSSKVDGPYARVDFDVTLVRDR